MTGLVRYTKKSMMSGLVELIINNVSRQWQTVLKESDFRELEFKTISASKGMIFCPELAYTVQFTTDRRVIIQQS